MIGHTAMIALLTSLLVKAGVLTPLHAKMIVLAGRDQSDQASKALAKWLG